MIDDALWVDGNAAGGVLARFFAFDVTRMLITCDNCSAESPLGALRLYGGQMGIILRCTKCGAINVRALENGGALTLDARGARRMTYRPESNSS
jgi:hypothetical protein